MGEIDEAGKNNSENFWYLDQGNGNMSVYTSKSIKLYTKIPTFYCMPIKNYNNKAGLHYAQIWLP